MFAAHPALARAHNRAFTLIELIVIIVVLAILSGVAIPKYIDYTANAKASAAKTNLGALRGAIGNYYANTALIGTPAYPSLSQLTTVGAVMQEAIPANPYNNASTVGAATWATTPPVTGSFGYNYDVATGRVWLNSTTTGVNEHLF